MVSVLPSGRVDGEDAQAVALIRQGVEIWLVRQPDGWGRIEVVEKAGNTSIATFGNCLFASKG